MDLEEVILKTEQHYPEKYVKYLINEVTLFHELVKLADDMNNLNRNPNHKKDCLCYGCITKKRYYTWLEKCEKVKK